MAFNLFKNIDGEILKRPDDGRIVGADDCCCPDPPPVIPATCTCLGADWVLWYNGAAGCEIFGRKYIISGYYDCLVSNCGGQTPYGSVWDGSFFANGRNRCTWTPMASVYMEMCGYKMYHRTECYQAALNNYETKIVYVATSGGYWLLVIAGYLCFAWAGTKTTGTTPEGVYTAYIGSPSALSVEFASDLANPCTTTTTTTT